MRYNETTLRYFERPPQPGTLSGAAVFCGEAGSRPLGTWVRFTVRAGSDAGGMLLAEARFAAFGCPHVIAVAAYVAERAVACREPWTLPEPVSALAARFAVPVEKTGRLLIIEDAWLAALQQIGSDPISA